MFNHFFVKFASNNVRVLINLGYQILIIRIYQFFMFFIITKNLADRSPKIKNNIIFFIIKDKPSIHHKNFLIDIDLLLRFLSLRKDLIIISNVFKQFIQIGFWIKPDNRIMADGSLDLLRMPII